MHVFVYVGHVCVEARVQLQVLLLWRSPPGLVWFGLRQGLFLTWTLQAGYADWPSSPRRLPDSGSPALAL